MKRIEVENGVSATAKYVRMAPRKVRLVVDQIRNKSVSQALELLQFAENNNNLRANNLYIAEAYVDEGPTLKRIRPRAKGSASRINKRTSHITIVVAPRKEA